MSARSHGISCTSFLVYSPDLPIQVTIAYLDFAVFGQLVPCTRLNIRFLFVEPRFRYVFLSPPLTEVSFDSRYRVHRQQVPQGNCTPDVQHARRTKKPIWISPYRFCLFLVVQQDLDATFCRIRQDRFELAVFSCIHP